MDVYVFIEPFKGECVLIGNYKRGTSLLMGRPAKNANNPLVRLRHKLSEWSPDQVTRKVLAKKTGIPEASLRDIEIGRYKLTPEVATKISFATKVDPRSLLAGDDPLLDLLRQPLSKDSSVGWSLAEFPQWTEEHKEAIGQLLFALLDTAEAKKISRLVDFSFENWLTTTIEAFGSCDLFAQKLTDRLTSFDPRLMPDKFLPKNKKLAKDWSDFEYELEREYVRLLDQYEADNPDDPVFFSSAQVDASTKDLLELEAKLKNKIRFQARENVARKRKEDAAKAAISKPPSGKRPRSSRSSAA